MNTKTMLLVDNGQREIVEDHVLLEKRMGTEQKIDVAEGETIHDLLARRPTFAASEYRYANAGGFGEGRDGGEMLAGKNLGRRHECGLPPRFDDRRGSGESHHGFARSNVPLQQPQHSLRAGKISNDVVDRLL